MYLFKKDIITCTCILIRRLTLFICITSRMQLIGLYLIGFETKHHNADLNIC